MGAEQGFVDLGFAKPDLARKSRQGVSEVIFGAGKTADQIVAIAQSLVEAGQTHLLATRVDAEKARAVVSLWEQAGQPVGADQPAGADTPTAPAPLPPIAYHETARIITFGDLPTPTGGAYVVVACAGTSDLYCAEEAALTAEMLGSRVVRLYDVGVAGIHRLLAHADKIAGASAVVAIAGMEGALTSVIGGLASCPVIGCPTSVGYGASLEGLAALLSMINSCASGVSVVNIDNGFGAGYQAALIDHTNLGDKANDD